jgi:hypothetical protein
VQRKCKFIAHEFLKKIISKAWYAIDMYLRPRQVFFLENIALDCSTSRIGKEAIMEWFP